MVSKEPLPPPSAAWSVVLSNCRRASSTALTITLAVRSHPRPSHPSVSLTFTDTHTNRILTQTGSIVDESLDNEGHVHGSKTIGTYESLMTFNGHESSTQFQGQDVTEREYNYTPFHGITSVSAVYTDAEGKVVGTRVLVESNAGGSSTIADL